MPDCRAEQSDCNLRVRAFVMCFSRLSSALLSRHTKRLKQPSNADFSALISFSNQNTLILFTDVANIEIGPFCRTNSVQKVILKTYKTCLLFASIPVATAEIFTSPNLRFIFFHWISRLLET